MFAPRLCGVPGPVGNGAEARLIVGCHLARTFAPLQDLWVLPDSGFRTPRVTLLRVLAGPQNFTVKGLLPPETFSRQTLAGGKMLLKLSVAKLWQVEKWKNAEHFFFFLIFSEARK